jgi:hypothetical protein
MKKHFFFLLLVLFGYGIIAQNELSQLRNLFFQPQQAQSFIQLGTSVVSQDDIVIGYKGAATAISAQYKDWPHEKAIQKNPWNAELRFIRLTIQCQSPSFLGYQSNIAADCQLISDHFSMNYVQVKDAYWQNVIKFILQQELIEVAQKNKLQAYLI